MYSKCYCVDLVYDYELGLSAYHQSYKRKMTKILPQVSTGPFHCLENKNKKKKISSGPFHCWENKKNLIR